MLLASACPMQAEPHQKGLPTMKKFMRLWPLVRRFNAFFSFGFLTLIPIINVLATWLYAICRLDAYESMKRVMEKNVRSGLPAFDRTTRRAWSTWFSESLVVMAFTAISVAVNEYAYTTWPSEFDNPWIVENNLFYWYQVAAWCLSGFLIASSLMCMINAIYDVHRNNDPEYMDEADITPDFLARRKKNIEDRQKEEALAAEKAGLASGDLVIVSTEQGDSVVAKDWLKQSDGHGA